MQCLYCRLNHIAGGVEVRLADLQVHDILALAFQRPRLVEDLEGSFGAQARHAIGKAKFVLCGRFHSDKTRHYIPPRWVLSRAILSHCGATRLECRSQGLVTRAFLPKLCSYFRAGQP